MPDLLTLFAIVAALSSVITLVQSLRLKDLVDRRPPTPERPPAPTVRPDAAGAILFRLSAVGTPEWVAVRTEVWEARQRWFASPKFRRKFLGRLAPGGGEAAVPQGRFAQASERWLLFLASLAEGARDADAREAIAGTYAPWRGFCIDLCRAVEERREGLTEREARQLPPPPWFEPLRRLDAAAFPDTTHDFTAHLQDRQLLGEDPDIDLDEG